MAPRVLGAALLAAMLALVPARPGAAHGAPGARVSGGGGAEEAAPAPATLSALRAEPLAHLGRDVRFVLQLDRPLDAWNPFDTRFGPGDFAGFRAWPDEAFLWEREAYEDPATRLFARRGSAAQLALSAAAPYQRFEVRAVVRDVFLGEPWIEIVGATRLAEQVTEGAILHASRGLALALERNVPLARAQLERACAGLLPAHARAELERRIAELE